MYKSFKIETRTLSFNPVKTIIAILLKYKIVIV